MPLELLFENELLGRFIRLLKPMTLFSMKGHWVLETHDLLFYENSLGSGAPWSSFHWVIEPDDRLFNENPLGFLTTGPTFHQVFKPMTYFSMKSYQAVEPHDLIFREKSLGF